MTELERNQRNVLHALLNLDRNTELYDHLGLSSVTSYETLSQQCPVTDWNIYEPFVSRLKTGAKQIIGQNRISRFAISSGSTGSGKHIPVPHRRLISDQQFMKSVLRLIISELGINVWKLLKGQHLSIPGSLDLERTDQHSYLIGEITAHLADIAPQWSQFKQLISPQQLIKLSIPEKLDLIIQKARSADVRLVTAAPCWLPTLFSSILETTNSSSISDCWPNLNVIIAGGMNVSPYLDELKALWGNSTTFPLIVETYGASEGYFGYSLQTGSKPLKLVTNQNIFYEGIPEGKSNPVPCWEFEEDHCYNLVITSNSGLWRYDLGDRIRCISTSPLAIKIEGRDEIIFNRYGEAVALQEVEAIIGQYLGEENSYRQISGQYIHSELPCHQWSIITESSYPWESQSISKKLDKQLQSQNRHYQMRRESKVLASPHIECLSYTKALEKYASHLKPQQGIPPKL